MTEFTEEDAKREIAEHINKGKIFMLGSELEAPSLPITLEQFHWVSKKVLGLPTTSLVIKHRVTCVRRLTEEEVKDNWFEGHLYEKRFKNYYETILD